MLAHLEIKPAHVIVDDLLAAGVLALSGKPKIGKSWLVLALAMAVANGRPFLGHNVKRGRALLLALEDNQRRMKSRVDKLTAGGTVMSPRFDYALEAPHSKEGLEEWLAEQVEKKGYTLIVVDTLAKVRPRGKQSEGAWQADYEAFEGLKKLADKHNVAVVVTMHNRKGVPGLLDAQDMVATTGGTMAGCDGYWVLEKTGQTTEDEKPIFKMTMEHRDLEGAELALTFDRGKAEWEVKGRWGAVALGTAQQAVLRAIEEAGEEGAGLMDIARAASMTKNSVNQALIKLRARGAISTKRGLNMFTKADEDFTD